MKQRLMAVLAKTVVARAVVARALVSKAAMRTLAGTKSALGRNSAVVAATVAGLVAVSVMFIANGSRRTAAPPSFAAQLRLPVAGPLPTYLSPSAAPVPLPVISPGPIVPAQVIAAPAPTAGPGSPESVPTPQTPPPPPPPVAGFPAPSVHLQQTGGCALLCVSVQASAASLGGVILDMVFDWGDGLSTVVKGQSPNASSCASQAARLSSTREHSYLRPGPHRITVRAHAQSCSRARQLNNADTWIDVVTP